MKSNGYLTEKEKDTLKAELDKAAIEVRVISLKEIARRIGIKKMKQEQVMGVIHTFLYRHPDYKVVKMLKHRDEITSLFNSITFIDKGLEFD